MFPEPIGLWAVRAILPTLNQQNRLQRYRAFIFIATFASYLCFHMTRRPIAIVKAVLNYNGSCYKAQPQINVTINSSISHTWCDWEPFGSHPDYLAYLDTVYLFSYAVCMFVSGFVAERMHLRYFLSLGMILSGLTTFAFGLGHTFDIHSIWFYLAVQAVAGGVQSTGWPAVVTIMNKWFGKQKKGLIFGVWNAHTSVGNIVGALLAGVFVQSDWAYSFYIPGIVCALVGLFVFLFVPAEPEDIGMYEMHFDSTSPPVPPIQSEQLNNDSRSQSLVTVPNANSDDDNENTNLLINSTQPLSDSQRHAISFWKALVIPGKFYLDNSPFSLPFSSYSSFQLCTQLTVYKCDHLL